MRSTWFHFVVTLTLATQGALACSAPDEARAQPAPPSDEDVRLFESRVRPVLVEHCVKCHGPTKQWAGLRVDSRETLLRGGDSGPAIVPGKPQDSLLIRLVREADDEQRMPRDGRLTDAQIDDLTRWIARGAPFPVQPPVAARQRSRDHWAFRPIAAPSLPAVRDIGWLRSQVDAFILHRLESASLAPVAPADKRALLRRLTFDLTGLPPTLDELDSFLADEGADAYERLVDRLLAAPAYGERWGRHWLDVARYADSNGLDENIAHGNAWRYRDYVVRSFNRDKPFDAFIVEQLAGDLLAVPSTDAAPSADTNSSADKNSPADADLPADTEPEGRHERLIATGFLSIGPKVLAEVNEAKMRMDILDEQLDTFGRVFLGLTLGCARCHDHKFDPIDAVDYYGLAGVFKSTRTMDTYTKVAKWHEHELDSVATRAMKAEFEKRRAELKQAVAAAVAKADEELRGRDPDAAKDKTPEQREPLYGDEHKAELKRIREALAECEKNPPDLPSTMGVTEDKVVDLAVHLRGDPLKLGDVVPRRTPSALATFPAPTFTAAESGRRELAQWLVDPRHPLTSRVLVNRVWSWHFGQAIVRSTENFGALGERPSHPELLDWLARRFQADGWSLKSLHRMLVTSSTYRQTSRPTAEQAAALARQDPDNRLYGRASLRRLSAEELRDALLSVGDQLDGRMGGSLLKVKNRGYLFDHTSIDKSDYTSQRRSLYLPVIRNHVFDWFQLLDFPDPAVPTGHRASTTVAPQALLMMNSDFVMQAAERLADRVLNDDTPAGTTPRDGDVDDERLNRLYRIVYGRDATVEQRRADRTFLRDVAVRLASATDGAEATTGSVLKEKEAGTKEGAANERRRRAWSVLCHALLASNEFVYVP